MNKRLSSVKHYKNSTEQLIKILEQPIVAFKKNERINQTDLKSKLQSKKNAFDRAKDTIEEIQNIEEAYSDSIDTQWLRKNIGRLCDAGEFAISEMLGNMDEDIDTSDLGGSEINAAIDVRGKSIYDIKEIFDGIDFMRELLDKSEGKTGKIFKKKKTFEGGVVEKRTWDK